VRKTEHTRDEKPLSLQFLPILLSLSPLVSSTQKAGCGHFSFLSRHEKRTRGAFSIGDQRSNLEKEYWVIEAECQNPEKYIKNTQCTMHRELCV
jgi:hypothetical protein